MTHGILLEKYKTFIYLGFLGKPPQNHLIMTPHFTDFLPEYQQTVLLIPPIPIIKHKRVKGFKYYIFHFEPTNFYINPFL